MMSKARLDLRGRSSRHFKLSWYNLLLKPRKWLCSGILTGLSVFHPFPFSTLNQWIYPTQTSTSTPAVLITADLHVCSRTVWEEMKHKSQWLLLHSFYHVSERAPPWAHIQPANIDISVCLPHLNWGSSFKKKFKKRKYNLKERLLRTGILSLFLVVVLFCTMQMWRSTFWNFW